MIHFSHHYFVFFLMFYETNVFNVLKMIQVSKTFWKKQLLFSKCDIWII